MIALVRKLLWVASAIAMVLLLAWLIVVVANPAKTNYQQAALKEAAVTNRQPVAYEPRGFAAGERAQYVIKFLKVPIGKATFEVKPRATAAAPWDFELQMQSHGDLLSYHVRSTMDPTFQRTTHYHSVQKDRASRTVELQFDSRSNTVQCLLNGATNGQPVGLPARFYDPLSMIYRFREMDFASGQTVGWSVTDGKEVFEMKVAVRGHEEIQIGERKLRAIRVEPNLGEFRGVFHDRPDSKLQIWFSDDAYCIPLRIQSKFNVGEFVVELEEYTRPAPAKKE